MKKFKVSVILVCLAAVWITAQDLPVLEPQPPAPQPAAPVQPAVTAQNQPKSGDALVLFRQGRDLELKGKRAEAAKYYQDAIAVCNAELARDSTRMDAYTIKCWSLFRLEQYKQVIDVGLLSLKVKYDARVVETMGEAYYFLNDMANCLKSMQSYINNTGENADRVATAYFYTAEAYVRLQKFEHADISYSMAVYKEPSMARWWLRYAQLAEKLEDYQRSYAYYTKALLLSPDNKEASDGQKRMKQYL